MSQTTMMTSTPRLTLLLTKIMMIMMIFCFVFAKDNLITQRLKWYYNKAGHKALQTTKPLITYIAPGRLPPDKAKQINSGLENRKNLINNLSVSINILEDF